MQPNKTKMNLPEPVAVSPLIRVIFDLCNVFCRYKYNTFFFLQFSRYAFLTAGIVYGLVSHSRLSQKESKFREIEGEKNKIRDQYLAVERARQQESKFKLCNSIMEVN